MKIARLRITAENRDAVQKIQEVGRSQDQMAAGGVASQNRMQTALKGTLVKLGSMAAAYVGIRAAIGEVNKMADEFIEKEDDYHKLGVAVEMVGYSWNMLEASMRSSFSEMQAVTRFSDNEMARALRTMILLTQDFDASQQNLSLAMDMASSGMWNLETSARYLAMAMEGNYQMLARYVPALRDLDSVLGTNRTSAQELDYVMQELSNTFGGLAEKDAQSLAGALDILENRLSDLRAETGQFAAEIQVAFQVVMQSILKFVGDVTGLRKEYVDEWASTKKELIALDRDELKERERLHNEYYEDAYQRMQDMIDEGYKSGGLAAEELKHHLQVLQLIREQLKVVETQLDKDHQRQAVNLQRLRNLHDELDVRHEITETEDEAADIQLQAYRMQERFRISQMDDLGRIENTYDKLIEQAMEEGELKAAFMLEHLKQQEIALHNMGLMKEEAQELSDIMQMGMQLAADVLYEAMGGAFDNVERMFVNMIKRMIAEALVLAAIMQFTGAPIGGFNLGKILFPSAGLERKAGGGDVAAGRPYMVGERGRELFVPTQSGVIVPNNTTNNIVDNSELIKEVRMLREAIYSTALTPEIISEANQVGNLTRQVL